MVDISNRSVCDKARCYRVTDESHVQTSLSHRLDSEVINLHFLNFIGTDKLRELGYHRDSYPYTILRTAQQLLRLGHQLAIHQIHDTCQIEPMRVSLPICIHSFISDRYFDFQTREIPKTIS